MVDPSSSFGDCLAVAREWARRAAEVEAGYLRAIAAAAGPAPRSSVADDWVVLEVGAALGLSARAAALRVRYAREIVASHPAVLAALEDGEICPQRARVLVEELGRLPDDAVALVERDLLCRARNLTAAQLRRAARKAVLRAAGESAADQHRAAVEDRQVVRTVLDQGMGELRAYLPLDALESCWAALTGLVRELPEEGRTADQLRADSLVHLLTGGQAPQVTLVLHGTVDDVAPVLAELNGTPLPQPVLDRLAAGATVRLHTTAAPEPTRGYRPGAALDRWVRDRDRRCRFPGCTAPAERADLDHVKAWAAGGTTSAENLLTLCRHHHRAKHDAGWAPRPSATGAVTWTSPTGARYQDPPPF